MLDCLRHHSLDFMIITRRYNENHNTALIRITILDQIESEWFTFLIDSLTKRKFWRKSVSWVEVFNVYFIYYYYFYFGLKKMKLRWSSTRTITVLCTHKSELKRPKFRAPKKNSLKRPKFNAFKKFHQDTHIRSTEVSSFEDGHL